MTEKYTPPTDDELMRVYREANEAAMHEANLRDGFGSNMSRESILAGLRAVAELGMPSAAHDAQVLRDAAGRLHRVTEIGNMFGGYDCSCGEPWLETLGGCGHAKQMRAEADRIAGGVNA